MKQIQLSVEKTLIALAICSSLFGTAQHNQTTSGLSVAESRKIIESITFFPNNEHAARAVSLFGKPEEVCLENEESLPTQPWEIGRTSKYYSSSVSKDASETSQEIGIPTFTSLFRLENKLQYFNTSDGNTYIIVIDDFSGLDRSKNPPTPTISHGDLVVSHIRSILNSASYRIDTSEYDSDKRNINKKVKYVPLKYHFFDKSSNQRTITIIPIHADEHITPSPYGFSLIRINELSADISNVINSLSLDHSSNLILNMSFVAIPCRIGLSYRIAKSTVNELTDATFKDYLEYLRKNNDNGKFPSFSEIIKVLSTMADDDLFVSIIKNAADKVRGADGKFLAVASSGNYGLDFTLAPASRPEVLGVGGVSWESINKSMLGNNNSGPFKRLIWSNAGDIYSVGGWFTIKQDILARFCETGNCIEKDLMNNLDKYENFGYSGTSFSAPSVTAYFALRANNSTSAPCYTNEGMGFSLYKTDYVNLKIPPYKPLDKLTPTKFNLPNFKGGNGGVLNFRC